jgi:hypothetical protein
LDGQDVDHETTVGEQGSQMATAAGRRARGVLIVLVLLVAAAVALTANGAVGADPPPDIDRGVADRDAPPAPTENIATAEGSTPSTAAAPTAGPPSLARLLEIADEVSADGRYVRIGDVEISASPVVTRDG